MTQSAPQPANEKQRIRALHQYSILDTGPELAFDDLVQLASHICGTPMALVSLVDDSRQWFKARLGLDAAETPRDVAFCAHAILEPESVMQVCDAKQDDRFKDNPLVTGHPNISFYAGAPLVTSAGESLGTLCVLDTVAKKLDQAQIESLAALSRQVVAQLEIRLTNQLLQRRNEELSQFAYRVSHDFKSPLSSSKRISEFLLSDLEGNDLQEARDNALRINQQMIKLENFVEEMLNLAQADLADEDIETIDLALLLQEVENRHGQMILQNKVRVRIDIETGLGLETSKIRLFQVLDNLISNAVKYRDPEEENAFVNISCRTLDDMVEIVIADNGVGIPADYQDKVGSLFKRFHPEMAAGSGLGIAIVYKHIEALGASLNFRSSSAGTSFKILLPRNSSRGV